MKVVTTQESCFDVFVVLFAAVFVVVLAVTVDIVVVVVVIVGPRNLTLKFGQNWVSNC